jgi:hypothetical protein
MTLVEHANVILNYLAKSRRPDDRIPAVTSVELLKATDRNPPDYAVTYGQANSLLDLASMKANLPLIGRLVTFDHSDDPKGPWANWLPFESLLYYSAPRLKAWSDGNIELIRSELKPGTPAALWSEIENESAVWLAKALDSAQGVVRIHVDDFLKFPPAQSATK